MATRAEARASEVPEQPSRLSLPPFPLEEFVLPGVILALLTVAEYVTAAIDPKLGLPFHAGLLVLLVGLGARTPSMARRELYWTLALAPIIRIGSLAMPLGRLPSVIWWYPIIGLPIFAAAFVTMRKLGYRPAMVGLTIPMRGLPAQLALIPLGSIMGVGEYLIFRPAPLVQRFSFEDLWLPALILIV